MHGNGQYKLDLHADGIIYGQPEEIKERKISGPQEL